MIILTKRKNTCKAQSLFYTYRINPALVSHNKRLTTQDILYFLGFKLKFDVYMDECMETSNSTSLSREPEYAPRASVLDAEFQLQLDDLCECLVHFGSFCTRSYKRHVSKCPTVANILLLVSGIFEVKLHPNESIDIALRHCVEVL